MSDAPCRTDLGPLTKRLLEQQQEIERLRAERDEARRERDDARRKYCNEIFVNGGIAPSDFAKYLGWDCYKEDRK
jgi:hypothetical protein